jgi:hypothetical protein
MLLELTIRVRRGIFFFLAAAVTLLLGCAVRQGPSHLETPGLKATDKSPSNARGHAPRRAMVNLSGGNVRPAPILPRRYAAFVGVHSRPVTSRRDLLRKTWFPSDRTTRNALENAGIYARFVIGTASPDASPTVEANLDAEAAMHGDIFRISVVESYENLLLKTMAYFRAAINAVDAQYYLKVDDDVYVRLDRIPAVVAQWTSDGSGYVGCLRTGGQMFSDPGHIYYEPLGALLPDRKYFGYMLGGIYSVSRQAAEWVTLRPDSLLRLSAGEDVSLGLQMLSLPVRFVEDRRLCAYYNCTNTMIGK